MTRTKKEFGKQRTRLILPNLQVPLLGAFAQQVKKGTYAESLRRGGEPRGALASLLGEGAGSWYSESGGSY